jgi:signal transduction histidine kinase
MNSFKSDKITEPGDFLTAIVNSALFGVISVDENFRILVINKLAKQYLQLNGKLNQIAEKKLFDVLASSELALLKKKLLRCYEKGRKPFVLTATEIEGNFYTIRGSILLKGMLVTIQNVTPIIVAQKSMLQSIIQGQEEERKRLAKEIHDGLGPLVSTAKMNFESLETDLPDEFNHLKKRFEEGYAMLDDIANEARSLSHALMPRVLEDFGLISAIESLCDKINRANRINVLFLYSDHEVSLTKEMQLAFYRVLQELINNVLKYAKASKLDIQLIKREDSITLIVEDNGDGFDLDTVLDQGEGIGIKNIQTRITYFGGAVHIDTLKGRGTIVTAEVPLILK